MSGLFKSRSTTVTKDPMLTGEQSQIQQMLTQLATTGQYGNINLGQGYDGSLGDFNMTPTETSATQKLYDYLNQGTPDAYNTARSTLTKLTDTNFNPDDPSSGYAAYARQVARAGNVANDALNREAAITGDRYSTSIGRQKADLGAQLNDQLSTKLADLYNSQLDRAGNAANSLAGVENNVQSNIQDKLNLGFNQGGLQRILNNMKADSMFNEWNRARQEKLSRIGIGQDVFGRGVQFGQMSTTTKAPSIFSSILGQVSPIVGSYNTAKYGSANAPNQANLSDMVKALTSASKGGL